VRIVAIERHGRLKLDARLVQSILNPAQRAQRLVCARAARVLFDRLQQQALGTGAVLLRRSARADADVRYQDRCGTDPGVDR
jgi:hypothetical protein